MSILINKDTRVINANPSALNVMQTSMVEILNRTVLDIFPPNRSAELIAVLKQTGRDPDGTPSAFFVGFGSRMLRVVVTPLRIQNVPSGWALALEGARG